MPDYVPTGHSWRRTLNGWGREKQAAHHAETQRLMTADPPWNPEAAAYLAFEKMQGDAEAARLSKAPEGRR